MVKYQHPKVSIGFVVLTFLIILLLFYPAFAQSPEVKQAWKHFTEKHGTQWQVTWDASLGTPKSLRGLYKPLRGDPEEVAKSFLAENQGLFQVRADLSDLSLRYRKQSPAGTHLTFEQSYGGLPVFNGDLDIHITKTGQIFLIYNRYIPEAALKQLSLTPRLFRDEVVRLASDDYRNYKFFDNDGNPFWPKDAIVKDEPGLGIYHVSTGCRLAYRLTVGALRYVIDANSGEILNRIELIQFVDGTGKIFDPNPVNTLNNTSLQDNNDKDYLELSGAYVPRES